MRDIHKFLKEIFARGEPYPGLLPSQVAAKVARGDFAQAPPPTAPPVIQEVMGMEFSHKK